LQWFFGTCTFEGLVDDLYLLKDRIGGGEKVIDKNNNKIRETENCLCN
jgi:hypothetical protein